MLAPIFRMLKLLIEVIKLIGRVPDTSLCLKVILYI